jgi:hypothetical protein
MYLVVYPSILLFELAALVSQVLSVLDGFAAEAATHSATNRAAPATRFDELEQSFDAVVDSIPEGCASPQVFAPAHHTDARGPLWSPSRKRLKGAHLRHPAPTYQASLSLVPSHPLYSPRSPTLMHAGV